MAVGAELRRRVVERAGNRCEYCVLAQASQEAAFHVGHVVPVSAGGPTTLGNLALACVSCSLRKGARRVAPDPMTNTPATLFNPRREAWRTHFHWEGVRVVGLTPTGRATVAVLQMNRALAEAIRAEETHRGRHPPPDPG